MTTTDDPEEFRDAWNRHIGELDGLKQTLPVEKWDRLDDAAEELRSLVEEAAKEFEEDEGDE